MNEMDVKNQEVWQKAIEHAVMVYPAENVARFLGRNYSRVDRSKLMQMNALDIGTGSGRNLRALLDYGFRACGIDYLEDACKIAKENLKGYNNLVDIYCGNYSEYNFDTTFDVILLFGVVFIRDVESIKKDLLKVNKLLKNNGKMFVNFRTKDDYLFNTGTKIGDNTFILEDEYEGATYSFFNLEEVKELLTEAGFKIENIEREDYYKNNLKQYNSWWLLQVTK